MALPLATPRQSPGTFQQIQPSTLGTQQVQQHMIPLSVVWVGLGGRTHLSFVLVGEHVTTLAKYPRLLAS